MADFETVQVVGGIHVLRVAERLTEVQVRRIRENWAARFGEKPLIVIEDGMSIEYLSDEELARLGLGRTT